MGGSKGGEGPGQAAFRSISVRTQRTNTHVHTSMVACTMARRRPSPPFCCFLLLRLLRVEAAFACAAPEVTEGYSRRPLSLCVLGAAIDLISCMQGPQMQPLRRCVLSDGGMMH